MNLNNKVAVRLKSLREEKNISQLALAKSIGLSNSAYSRIENGEVQITLNILEKIAEEFKISINEIMNFPNSNINNFNNNQLCPIQNGILNINLSAEQILKVLEVLQNTK